MNTPPEILSPSGVSTDLLMVQDPVRLRVFAQDRDGDQVRFFWTGLPLDAVESPVVQDSDGIWLSVVSFEVQPELDRRPIQVRVVDLPEGADASHTFLLELP